MSADSDTFVTYKRADGDPVGGEYGWVTDTEFFEDEDYVEVVKEVWTLASRETIKLGETDRWCFTCDAEMTLPEPVNGPVFCSHQCALEAKQEQGQEVPNE